MNKWKGYTKIVMLGIVIEIILILIYDAVAISYGGTEASISSMLINLSYKQPSIVAFLCLFLGILIGHLFWRMKPNKDTIENGIDRLDHK